MKSTAQSRSRHLEPDWAAQLPLLRWNQLPVIKQRRHFSIGFTPELESAKDACSLSSGKVQRNQLIIDQDICKKQKKTKNRLTIPNNTIILYLLKIIEIHIPKYTKKIYIIYIII